MPPTPFTEQAYYGGQFIRMISIDENKWADSIRLYPRPANLGSRAVTNNSDEFVEIAQQLCKHAEELYKNAYPSNNETETKNAHEDSGVKQAKYDERIRIVVPAIKVATCAVQESESIR